MCPTFANRVIIDERGPSFDQLDFDIYVIKDTLQSDFTQILAVACYLLKSY